MPRTTDDLDGCVGLVMVCFVVVLFVLAVGLFAAVIKWTIGW